MINIFVKVSELIIEWLILRKVVPPSGINSVNFVAEAKYLKNKQTRFESQKHFFCFIASFPWVETREPSSTRLGVTGSAGEPET